MHHSAEQLARRYKRNPKATALSTRRNNYDRRFTGRYRTTVPVAAFGNHRERKCQTVNISPSGLRLISPDRIERGTPLYLKFVLDNGPQVQIWGWVVWTEPVGCRGTEAVGLAFEGGSLARQQITGWLEAQAVA